MPSKSPAQAKLMNIAAHTKGGYGGVPQSVGEEFHQTDKAKGKFKYAGGHAAADDGSGRMKDRKISRGFKASNA